MSKQPTATTAELTALAMRANAEGRVKVTAYGQVYLDGSLVRCPRIARALRGY